MWHEKYLYHGQVVKTKASYQYCAHCGLKIVGPANDTFPLCPLCFWKKHKWWAEAKHVVEHGLAGDGHYGQCTIKPDGVFVRERMITFLLFRSILNCGSLNKTPKCPDVKLSDYFPMFWVKKFFPNEQ